MEVYCGEEMMADRLRTECSWMDRCRDSRQVCNDPRTQVSNTEREL